MRVWRYSTLKWMRLYKAPMPLSRRYDVGAARDPMSRMLGTEKEGELSDAAEVIYDAFVLTHENHLLSTAATLLFGHGTELPPIAAKETP